MRRDDRDDPFDDIFREIERMMNEMASGGTRTDDTGFGADPHLDVHESTDTVRVVGDFPGVEKDDLGVKCDGRTVTISATTGHREYEERIQLPTRVDEHSADATFNNGVLEIVFDRADSSADIDL
jgi:HSP20 family protein